MTKAEWFESLAKTKRAKGFSEAEVAAYVADLEHRYAHVTETEFAEAFSRKAGR